MSTLPLLPLTAAASCVFAAGAVLYSKIRPRFSVRVNCWFCQGDFVVPYEEQNSWDCPHCEQYNGFLKDGDYNKIIAAQYTESLNPHSFTRSSRDLRTGAESASSLCNSCQINQQFKIKQLASFTPTREECFDQEIKAYQAHLERVYRLCQNCSGALEEKLSREESWLKPKYLQWKLGLSRRAGPSAKMVTQLSQMSSVPLKVAECLLSLIAVIEVLLSAANIEDSAFGRFLRGKGIAYELEPVLSYFVVLPLLATLCIALRSMTGPRRMANILVNLARAVFWFLSCCGFGWTLRLCSIAFVMTLLAAAVWMERSPSSSAAFLCAKSPSTPSAYSNQRDLDASSVSSTPRRDSLRQCATNDLDSSIEKLNIGAGRRSMSPLTSFSESPSSVCSSTMRKRPLVSPSRLDHSAFKVPSNSNLTKTSWVAGGYWQNTYVPSASPLFRLSRSSSQSSGIGSIRSGHRGHFSPPGSRPGSSCGELDCFSLCSEEPDTPETNEVQFNAGGASTPHQWETTAPVSYTWAAIIFLLGFSLAVNMCVVGYLYIR